MNQLRCTVKLWPGSNLPSRMYQTPPDHGSIKNSAKSLRKRLSINLQFTLGRYVPSISICLQKNLNWPAQHNRSKIVEPLQNSWQRLRSLKTTLLESILRMHRENNARAFCVALQLRMAQICLQTVYYLKRPNINP